MFFFAHWIWAAYGVDLQRVQKRAAEIERRMREREVRAVPPANKLN